MLMAVAVSRGPQRKLSQLTVRQVQPSFLGSGLLLHQAKVLFQGHFGSLQSLLTASQAVGRKHFV